MRAGSGLWIRKHFKIIPQHLLKLRQGRRRDCTTCSSVVDPEARQGISIPVLVVREVSVTSLTASHENNDMRLTKMANPTTMRIS